MIKAWENRGDGILVGDPDWVAEVAESVWDPYSLLGLSDAIDIRTPRGIARLKTGDVALLINGEVWTVSSDVMRALRQDDVEWE